MDDHCAPASLCRAVIIDYHGDIDRGRAAAAIRFFDEDAQFEARGEVLRGRDQILRFLENRQAQTERHTVHVIANAVTIEATADTVEISALVVLHARNEHGRYEVERVLDTVHRFRTTESGWKITSRRSSPLHAPA